MDDLIRFLREDEAMKTMSLFEGAPETRRISKSALKNWLVIAYSPRFSRFLLCIYICITLLLTFIRSMLSESEELLP